MSCCFKGNDDEVDDDVDVDTDGTGAVDNDVNDGPVTAAGVTDAADFRPADEAGGVVIVVAFVPIGEVDRVAAAAAGDFTGDDSVMSAPCDASKDMPNVISMSVESNAELAPAEAPAGRAPAAPAAPPAAAVALEEEGVGAVGADVEAGDGVVTGAGVVPVGEEEGDTVAAAVTGTGTGAGEGEGLVDVGDDADIDERGEVVAGGSGSITDVIADDSTVGVDGEIAVARGDTAAMLLGSVRGEPMEDARATDRGVPDPETAGDDVAEAVADDVTDREEEGGEIAALALVVAAAAAAGVLIADDSRRFLRVMKDSLLPSWSTTRMSRTSGPMSLAGGDATGTDVDRKAVYVESTSGT